LVDVSTFSTFLLSKNFVENSNLDFMKKLLYTLMMVALFGFLGCEKEEVKPNVETENVSPIILRSSTAPQFADVGSNGIIYLISDEQEIPQLEATIAQEEEDILNGIIGRPKYPYQSENCTISNGHCGLKCKPQKKGDCTSEFDCIILVGGY
jgi:hypothetical protein